MIHKFKCLKCGRRFSPKALLTVLRETVQRLENEKEVRKCGQ